jgi:hypothetical protein
MPAGQAFHIENGVSKPEDRPIMRTFRVFP